MGPRTTRRSTRWGVVAALGLLATTSCMTHGSPRHPTADRQARTALSAARPAASSWNSGTWGDPTADVVATDSSGRNQVAMDPGSLYTIENALGIHAIWSAASVNKYVTGKGVGVAVLDSGVSQVPGLSGAGKVTYGPDLSVEGNGVLADQDTYGHGTFMAGIIAGRGTSDPSSALSAEPPSVQLGIAPDAELLALKLAATDGSTDVSEVIAGIDWVVQHPLLPDGTPVRVINLSYGTDSTQSYLLDPLAAAVENAWRHGIVVVTSAGNAGAGSGRMTDPAVDPYVVAVAGLDNSDQPSGWNNPTAADFSSRGDGFRNPDLAAPGRSIVSWRDPGSFIDTTHPEGRVSGDATGALFRGSGTSQSAAVVSGVVALLLQAYPTHP